MVIIPSKEYLEGKADRKKYTKLPKCQLQLGLSHQLEKKFWESIIIPYLNVSSI